MRAQIPCLRTRIFWVSVGESVGEEGEYWRLFLDRMFFFCCCCCCCCFCFFFSSSSFSFFSNLLQLIKLLKTNVASCKYNTLNAERPLNLLSSSKFGLGTCTQRLLMRFLGWSHIYVAYFHFHAMSIIRRSRSEAF